MIYHIDTYTYYLIFISVKYATQNDTGQLLVIVLHQVDRLVQDRAYITQYSYYREYFRLSVNYIAYLTTLWGEHRVFVISIQTCNCNILKLGLLRFGLSH